VPKLQSVEIVPFVPAAQRKGNVGSGTPEPENDDVKETPQDQTEKKYQNIIVYFHNNIIVYLFVVIKTRFW